MHGEQLRGMPDLKIDKSQWINLLRNRTAGFAEKEGRRPRILITRIHPSVSDREVKTIATAFADMGFDVDINTAVQSPTNVARMATENDVHALGIPGISVKSKTLIPALLIALEENSSKDILVAVWGSVQRFDCSTAFIEIFGSETDATVCASRILDFLESRL